MGTLTLSEATYPLTLDGQGAIISGNLIINKSEDIIIKNLYVDGYGEVNGCHRCELENITFEHGGVPFIPGTRSQGHTLTVTDSPDDGAVGYGVWWSTFKRINAHGAIIAPGAYNTTAPSRSNTGINNLRFVECNIKSAPKTGTLDLHDPDNASIRVTDNLGYPDITHNTQNIHFMGGDLSDSDYLVKNFNNYIFYVDGTYCENYLRTHEGEVEFTRPMFIPGEQHRATTTRLSVPTQHSPRATGEQPDTGSIL